MKKILVIFVLIHAVFAANAAVRRDAAGKVVSYNLQDDDYSEEQEVLTENLEIMSGTGRAKNVRPKPVKIGQSKSNIGRKFGTRGIVR